MPSSLTEAASSIGQTLCLDLQLLAAPTASRATHQITSVDEKSGYVNIVSCDTKSSDSVFKAICKIVHNVYNAHRHPVTTIHTDSEEVFKAIQGRLGAVGIQLCMSPPGQHQQRCERYVQAIAAHTRSLLSGLDYVLPPEYIIYAQAHCAAMMNAIPNSRSRPSSPHELFTGTKYVAHYKYPMLPFGATCMVQTFDDKRHREASALGTTAKSLPLAELGVCFGMSPLHPGSFLFLVANGSISVRRVVQPVNVLPWNWQSHYVPRSVVNIPRALDLAPV